MAIKPIQNNEQPDHTENLLGHILTKNDENHQIAHEQRAGQIEQYDKHKTEDHLADDVKIELQNKANETLGEISKKLDKPEVQKVSLEGVKVVTLKGDDGKQGEKGEKPSKAELVEIIKPLIPEPIKGEKGKDAEPPSKEELVKIIKPLIPKPIKGEAGYTPVKGVDYFDGKKGDKGDAGKDADLNTEEIIRRIKLAPRGNRIKYSEIDDAPEFRQPGLAGTGYLREITDVNIINPANGDTLVYDSILKQWKNAQSSAASLTNNLIVKISKLGVEKQYNSAVDTDISRGLALLLAVSECKTGDTLHLAENTFDIGFHFIDMSLGNTGHFSIIGSGKYTTIIKSSYGSNVSVIDPIIVGASYSRLENLSIIGNSPNTYQPCWGVHDLTFAHDILYANVNDVYMEANSDCVYFIGHQIIVHFNRLTTKSNWDSFVMGAGSNSGLTSEIHVRNSLIQCLSNLSTATGVGLNIQGYDYQIMNVSDTEIVVTSTDVAIGVNAGGHSTLNLDNVKITTSGGVGNATDIYAQAGGTINVNVDCIYDPAKTNGTLNFVGGDSVLKLKQSTPQTITDGIPLLNQPASAFTNPKDLVNKDYVDLVVQSVVLDEYFSATPSSIGGIYYLMALSPASVSTVSSSAIASSTTTNIFDFATGVGFPNLDRLLAGNYQAHAHLSYTKGSGSARTVTVYFEVWKRTVGGSETKIGTASNSLTIPVSGNTEYDFDWTLATEATLLTTDRIILKWYAVTTGGTATATITMNVGGTSDSHFSINVNPINLSALFLPYSGATSDVDLGTKILKVKQSANINGELKSWYGTSLFKKMINMEVNTAAFPAGLTISDIIVKSDEDFPATELSAKIMYCDAQGTGAFPASGQVQIADISTSSGNYSQTGMTTSVATNKIIYLELTGDPVSITTVWDITIIFKKN